jgi:hypothetical protein
MSADDDCLRGIAGVPTVRSKRLREHAARSRLGPGLNDARRGEYDMSAERIAVMPPSPRHSVFLDLARLPEEWG